MHFPIIGDNPHNQSDFPSSDRIEIAKKLIEFGKKLYQFFDGLHKLGVEIHECPTDGFASFILDVIGIPPDNYNIDTDSGFCRDALVDTAIEFLEGKPTSLLSSQKPHVFTTDQFIAMLLKNLKKWHTSGFTTDPIKE